VTVRRPPEVPRRSGHPRADSKIKLRIEAVEDLDERACYDAIFCNSVLQWLTDPPRALANCHRALRPGGRMAAQAPARRNYCPNFTRAVAGLAEDESTRAGWSRFRSPWFFLETAQEYADLFEAAGFEVLDAEIREVTDRCSPEKAMEVFDSGAAAGYLNPACYEGGVGDDYLARARAVVAERLGAQADTEGLIDVTFHRVYVLARKPIEL